MLPEITTASIKGRRKQQKRKFVSSLFRQTKCAGVSDALQHRNPTQMPVERASSSAEGRQLPLGGLISAGSWRRRRLGFSNFTCSGGSPQSGLAKRQLDAHDQAVGRA